MVNWKQKLSSRKLWAAVTAVVLPLFIIFGIESPTQEQIIALIAAVGGLCAYIFGESYTDGQRAKKEQS